MSTDVWSVCYLMSELHQAAVPSFLNTPDSSGTDYFPGTDCSCARTSSSSAGARGCCTASRTTYCNFKTVTSDGLGFGFGFRYGRNLPELGIFKKGTAVKLQCWLEWRIKDDITFKLTWAFVFSHRKSRLSRFRHYMHRAGVVPPLLIYHFVETVIISKMKLCW